MAGILGISPATDGPASNVIISHLAKRVPPLPAGLLLGFGGLKPEPKASATPRPESFKRPRPLLYAKSLEPTKPTKRFIVSAPLVIRANSV